MNRKDFGTVLTPPKTVEYIISRLGEINEEQKILDPCVGPGIFVTKLLESGINKNQIFTFDVNKSYKIEMEKLGVSFKKQDTLLALYPDSYNEYDIILGNPPYLNKSSVYIKKNKGSLKNIYGRINSHETYSMFIVNSIWRLKEGGKLGFITSDSFLTLSTHKKLRRFIFNSCKINEILLAPKDLFSNQKVSTSPVIIILTKCTGQKNKRTRENNMMRIIPRVNSEDDYQSPGNVYEIEQEKYSSFPFNIFYIDVEKEVIELFEKSSKLEQYLQGYIGMHTHNNKKYIGAVEGTELEEIFTKRNRNIVDLDQKYKIVSKKDLATDLWKPYLKRGGGDQYYRPIMEALDWSEISKKVYDIPKNVPFEEEGLVISGVSSRLAARYMPKGCYWDSNKVIGFIIKNKSVSIHYMLGLLNSSLYNYFAKGIINNTNSIQISGIHALPFIIPNREIKEKIEASVTKIIQARKNNIKFDIIGEQKVIDEIIFNFYTKRFRLPIELKKKLDEQFSIYKPDKE